MIVVNDRAITGRGKNLGTTIDRRITEPSKNLTKILALAFSKVEII
jgi:hypothetical protein